MILCQKKSSSKNPNSFVIPRAVIALGKVIQFFSKDLATLFAAKLFSTPIKHSAPERELTMRNSAKNETLHLPVVKRMSIFMCMVIPKKRCSWFMVGRAVAPNFSDCR